jgi:UDP-2,4-diacetamido-2,4,6-trideoxy-beta-L-altropyranose hydrolase
MKVLVRVDAYEEIALGHLSRCIELGKALMQLQNEVVFLSYEDKSSKSRLEDSGIDFEVVSFKINDDQFVDKEMKILESFSTSIDILIVDSYNVNKKYFDEINRLFPKIVYLDDLESDYDNVDMVINPSCTVTQNSYISKNVLCGMEFIILGKDYQNREKKVIYPKTRSILVTMGGIDHFNLSSIILPILEKIDKEIEVNIVIGPYYENIKQIKNSAKNSNLSINFFEGLPNISSVMLRSDIAISAGGFTLYELSAMSIPTIGIALWDNQKTNVECLSKKDAIIPLYYHSDERFKDELSVQLQKLISNRELREKMSIASGKAVDGNGVDKIAKEINRLYG